MNDDPFNPSVSAEDALPPSWLAALRTLPSEHGGLSEETDAAVMATARETLAVIRRRRLRQRLWPVIAAAACVMLAFTLFFRPPSTPPSQVKMPAEDKYALILREVSSVFPHQINAIFSDGPDLEISLADQPIANTDQAVVIEICERGDCQTVITYIGQTLKIGQHRVTVRTDKNGGIVIDSPDFQGSGSTPGLHISTRRI